MINVDVSAVQMCPFFTLYNVRSAVNLNDATGFRMHLSPTHNTRTHTFNCI